MRRPAERREVALQLMAEHGLSQRRACTLALIDPKTVRREPVPDSPEIGHARASSPASVGGSVIGGLASCSNGKASPARRWRRRQLPSRRPRGARARGADRLAVARR